MSRKRPLLVSAAAAVLGGALLVPGADSSAALERSFLQDYERVEERRPKDALSLSPPSSPSDSQSDDVRILVAETLRKMGRGLSAQLILMDVAARSVGTSQGALALKRLESLSLQAEVDDSALEEFAYEFDGAVDSPPERSMMAWYRARALLRRGYKDWAGREVNQIAVDTAWNSEVLYDRAVNVLADGREDEAAALFSEIKKKSNVRASTKQYAELNSARLAFEKGDYQGSLDVVRGLDLPIRERARVLHEMAWSRYYLREYGKALGLLQVLDSGYYSDLKTPEADLLRMVIERDLCRYDLVKQSTAAFREKHGKTYKQIESRLPLELDSTLKQMALQTRFLQKRATLVHRLRQENRALEDNEIEVSPGLAAWLKRQLSLRERKLQSEVDRMIGPEVERIGNHFVELRDQMTFLEYEASIRPLTSVSVDETDYVPSGASKLKFEKLQWPVTNEAWWDELDSYEVLIRGRCQSALPSAVGISPLRRRPTPAPNRADPVDSSDEDDE